MTAEHTVITSHPHLDLHSATDSIERLFGGNAQRILFFFLQFRISTNAHRRMCNSRARRNGCSSTRSFASSHSPEWCEERKKRQHGGDIRTIDRSYRTVRRTAFSFVLDRFIRTFQQPSPWVEIRSGWERTKPSPLESEAIAIRCAAQSKSSNNAVLDPPAASRSKNDALDS